MRKSRWPNFMCGRATATMNPPPPPVFCLGWMKGHMNDGMNDRTNEWKNTTTQAYYISRYRWNILNSKLLSSCFKVKFYFLLSLTIVLLFISFCLINLFTTFLITISSFPTTLFYISIIYNIESKWISFMMFFTTMVLFVGNFIILHFDIKKMIDFCYFMCV